MSNPAIVTGNKRNEPFLRGSHKSANAKEIISHRAVRVVMAASIFLVAKVTQASLAIASLLKLHAELVVEEQSTKRAVKE
jgi:hypothetical protein